MRLCKYIIFSHTVAVVAFRIFVNVMLQASYIMQLDYELEALRDYPLHKGFSVMFAIQGVSE